MEPITCKRQSYRLWREGEFGNKARDWRTWDELKRSGFNGTVAIRYCGTGSGALFLPGLRVPQVPEKLDALAKAGWSLDDLYILEQLSPDQIRYRINGEVVRMETGLALFFSQENKLMRDALNSSGRQFHGISSIGVLRSILSPTDYDELMTLLDRFPDHVVEFSGFDQSVGLQPHRRMIVWEVRLY